MGGETQLGEILRTHMRRPETFASIGILSKRSGVPKATIANWLEGRVARPRHCLDLLKVAAALHLGADETCALLVAGGYPPLRELQQTTAGADEQAMLARWMVAPPPGPAAPPPAPLPAFPHAPPFAGDRAAAARAPQSSDLERAAVCLDESLALGQTLGDRTIIADTMLSLGNVAWLQDDLDRTEELFGQCLALYEGLGDDLGAIWSLIGLGNVRLHRRDYSGADRLHQQGLDRARQLGFKRMIAWSLTNQGATAIELGELRRAEGLLGEALALLRDLRDPQGIAHALCRLAIMCAQQGEPARAKAYYEESLSLHRALGDQPAALACAQGLASLSAREPQPMAGNGAWPLREHTALSGQCAVRRARPGLVRAGERRRTVNDR